jgi:hypothetical protein
MSDLDIIFPILIHLKDNIIIIALFHILNVNYHITTNKLLIFTYLLLFQYIMLPIRYKINYFNNKLYKIHKLFSYEFIYENYFGEQHLYIFAHEYHMFKTIDVTFYEKESYLNDINEIYKYYKIKLIDYLKKPDYDCAICLGDGDNWIALPCNHMMHSYCIKSWFISSNNTKCPLCMAVCNDEFISLLI